MGWTGSSDALLLYYGHWRCYYYHQQPRNGSFYKEFKCASRGTILSVLKPFGYTDYHSLCSFFRRQYKSWAIKIGYQSSNKYGWLLLACNILNCCCKLLILPFEMMMDKKSKLRWTIGRNPGNTFFRQFCCLIFVELNYSF